MRILTSTRAALRLIAAHTGERMIVILDRLVQAELRRVMTQRGQWPPEEER